MGEKFINLSDAIEAIKNIPVPYDSYYANITSAGKDYVISELERVYDETKPNVVEETYAHWKRADDIDEGIWRCSKCDLTWILNEGTPSQNEMRYCPKCGSYMLEYNDEERTDNN